MLKSIAPALLFILAACFSGQGNTEISGDAIRIECDLSMSLVAMSDQPHGAELQISSILKKAK